MCVGAMDGGCQIDIASVVPAHIVFTYCISALSVSLMAIILVNHQILKGIIKTGFGCQIKTFAEGNGARQLVCIIKNAHQMIVGSSFTSSRTWIMSWMSDVQSSSS